MDVDFHYHATYLAARLAGFSRSRALTIGTAAQMIDENSYYSVSTGGTTTSLHGHEIPVVASKGNVIHRFTPHPTFFAGGSENSSERDHTASVWAVYHFPPGNFDPGIQFVRHALGNPGADYLAEYYGDPVLEIEGIWKRREWGGTGPAPSSFEWLCRPYSPLSAFMVNNCREWVNNVQGDPSNVVLKEGLSDHLIGVTMHVLADTWAHQDFVGLPAKEINGRSRDEMYHTFYEAGSHTKAVRGAATLDRKEAILGFQKQGDARDATFGFERTDFSPSIVAYIGHAAVGHWPDHSALIWRYYPNWKGTAEHVRDNPLEYLAAFFHLVEALRCIRTNAPYRPFAINRANVEAMFAKIAEASGLTFGWNEAEKVLGLLWLDRSADWRASGKAVRWRAGLLDQEWDDGIQRHGHKWRDLQADLLGDAPIPHWHCGSSPWILQAQSAVKQAEDLKLGGVNAVLFRSLDYFKFNFAAKLHYRSIKNQLLLWGKRLIGEWHDGSAMIDDYAALGPQEEWRLAARKILVESLAERADQAKQDEVVVLLQYVDEARSRQELMDWFSGTAADLNEEHSAIVHKSDRVAIRNRAKSVASNEIDRVCEALRSAGDTTTTLELGASTALDTTHEIAWLPTEAKFQEVSYVSKTQSRHGALKKIDAALKQYHEPTASRRVRREAAQAIVTNADAYLAYLRERAAKGPGFFDRTETVVSEQAIESVVTTMKEAATELAQALAE